MIISNINSTNVFSSLLKVFGRKNLYKEANMYSIVVGVDELNIILK